MLRSVRQDAHWRSKATTWGLDHRFSPPTSVVTCHAGPAAAQERREAEQRHDDVLREPLLRRLPAAAVGRFGGAQAGRRHPGALAL